uniref:Reverse transcriptase domain-containing protein n=1 Tax=Tanacetum cinerariifolium TaxID=118510 RepID=A0A6L2KZB4_TANCI|nr:hypothetical protein [Tanacetum cinerariifolium]
MKQQLPDHGQKKLQGRIGCALLRKKFKEDLFTSCVEKGNLQDSSEPSNNNTSVANALQEPFEYGDPLEDIFWHQFTCELCGNDAHYGYNCPPKVSIIPNPKPFNNQTVDDLPPTVPSFDPTCYSEDGNSFTYDSTSNHVHDSPNVFNSHAQPTLYSCEFYGNDARYGHYCTPQEEEKQIEEEHAAKTRYWKILACYNDDDDDYTFAITHKEPDNSLSMGDEHLDTIPSTESNEFIKSSVENLIPNPSESEGEHEYDVPSCEVFTTFSNILFDADYDFYSSDDQSFSDEGIPKKIYSNPLFDEEIISMKIDMHHFNAESDLIESLLNHDSLIISSSSKIDSFFDEFAGELTLFKSISLGINETDCEPEEETHFIKRLLYDNSSPRPSEESISENSDAAFESLFPSPIPVEDSNSLMEEIYLSFTPNYSMLPGIEEVDYDSKRDIFILEEFLRNDSLLLSENESFHFDIPSSSRPPAKPPDGNSGILNVKVMGDISEHKQTHFSFVVCFVVWFCMSNIPGNVKTHAEGFCPTSLHFLSFIRDSWILGDKIICDLDKTPNLSQRSPQNCPKCGNPVDGHYCQGPPQINHHCCYEYGHPLEDIFCHQCTCELCGNGAHYGYNCPPKVPIIPNPKPFNNQTVDELPPTVPSFDPTCYSEDGNSFTYDSTSNLVHDSPNVFNPPSQPTLYSCEFCRNDAVMVTILHLKFRLSIRNHVTIKTLIPCKIFMIFNNNTFVVKITGLLMKLTNIPACYDDDDDEYTFAITHKEPDNSLSTGDEHLDTILATKSDEFIKSSVENLVSNPSESEGEHDDGQSFSAEGFPKKIYSSPLFDEEIISIKIDPHHFNAESDLIESLLNHDSSIISSSSKIDSLFDEFVGEPTLLKSIPLGINKTDCDPEEETHFIKRLLYDNSSPRPPEESISENSDAAFKSFFPSPIRVKDSDSLIEEIDLSFTPDYPMSPSIEEDDYDSERDILILEELLSHDSLSLPENKLFHFDIPSSSRPPIKPPDGNSGILNVKVMGDIFEHKVLMPRLMFTQSTLFLNQEKSPDLLPHQGHEAFQLSAECPMMIYEKNTPILDVLFFHLHPP